MSEDERWVEVSRSAYAHEAEGLQLLKDLIPDASPYRVWTNFEFMDTNGQWHEVDALVLGRRRLHLVELKAFTGIITDGTENNWTMLSMGGKRRTQRSPLVGTRRKAQRLASRIEQEARKLATELGLDWSVVRGRLPFIQESVFLHGSPFSSKLTGLAATGLFGPEGRQNETGLPGISERLLEAPTDRQRIDEDLGLIVANALKKLGIARRVERQAGSWTIAGDPLAIGEDWQQFNAANKTSGEQVVARVISHSPGTSTQARAAAYRRTQREYTLLSALNHESIVAPRDLVQDEDGNTVVVYPATPGFEPLDLVEADHQLSIDQQIEILVKVAEALAYAHRNHVAHRGLGPSAVLINTDDLARGTVDIRIVDWSFAGRVHTALTSTATFFAAPATASAADVDEVYQAPEDRWTPETDRIALDVFSLGALAYFILTGGQPPADNRSALQERLRRENGLDLAAAGGQFVGEQLRELVLRATSPNVSKRLARDPNSGEPKFGVQQFANAVAEYQRVGVLSNSPMVDALNPAIDDLIDGRFEVIDILGSGSTARGILVRDSADNDRRRVLKVGLDDSAASRLSEEADVLTQLAEAAKDLRGVVKLIEGPLELAGRTALLLSNCGEKTLADVIRYTPLPEGQLRSLGSQLLDVVVGLDSAGITHRDIKPANLGLFRPEGKRATDSELALFDFSLSRVPVDNLNAGTPPYRDPFLGEGLRTTYDSAAERYSAAVVLYEMATNTTPVYGDVDSAPNAMSDDVAVAPSDFTSNGISNSRAEALAEFFRRALARDIKQRFDTAKNLRSAWESIFEAPAVEVSPPVSPPEVPQLPDVEVAEEPRVNHSLSGLIRDFITSAGARPSVTRRQVVEMVLGTHEQSPPDPFSPYQVLADAADVTSARITQVFTELPDLWQKIPSLSATVDWLREELGRHMLESGGVTTPDLIAADWIGNLLETDDVENPQRSAIGLVRLILASVFASANSAESLAMVRRHGTGTVAMIALPGISRQLPAALSEVVEKLLNTATGQGIAIVAPAEAELPLREAAAKSICVPNSDLAITTQTLLRIGVNASTEAELSARGELHARAMPIESALRIVLQGVSSGDSFDRAELESRVRARFPALSSEVPRRPELDALVLAAAPGISWAENRRRYLFPDSAAGSSGVPSYHTRIPLPRSKDEDRIASDIERILRISARDHTYRGLGVPMGYSDRVAEYLVSVFGVTHIDITDFVLQRLRDVAEEERLPWDEILAADAGSMADRAELKDMVADVIPNLVEAVNAGPGPVLLTDLSTLAAYGQLSTLFTWADINSNAAHAVWSLIPQPDEAGGGPGPRVDHETFPRSGPEQFVQLGVDDLAVLRRLADKSREALGVGEAV
jgi:serine/threonine protein kinase